MTKDSYSREQILEILLLRYEAARVTLRMAERARLESQVTYSTGQVTAYEELIGRFTREEL